MKRIFINGFILLVICIISWCSFKFLSGNYAICGYFISGCLFGMLIMNFRIAVRNDKINSYKRELERESVSQNDANSRVKVLEAKIDVLEKALENALNK